LLTVIGSNVGRERWLADCSASVKSEHFVVVNDGYELGKIRWVLENTTVDRFLFLQDSFIVKDMGLFDLLDSYSGSVALFDDPAPYGCYAGVFERCVLERVGVPVVGSKRDAVRLELEWCAEYVEAAGGVPVLFPELRDEFGFVQKRYGRDNLVLENSFVVKYKGTWKEEQLVT
jgi:hypothetical protein